MQAYIGCCCHTSFRASEARRNQFGMLICPRCGLLHKAPVEHVESDTRQRARRRRQLETQQGRLF